LDAAAGQAFSLHGGDTLIEVPPGRVDSAVLMAAANDAQALKFDMACTRYFAAPAGFAVLFVWSCVGEADFDDGQVLSFFDLRGRRVAGMTSDARLPSYETLVPKSRPRTSPKASPKASP
jgi:hypothetical protein